MTTNYGITSFVYVFWYFALNIAILAILGVFDPFWDLSILGPLTLHCRWLSHLSQVCVFCGTL